jgi:GT2 family glycosyltransferase
MTRAPALAIVTVTFNGGPVIDDFMTSLAAQDLSDWLLFVVDNASADDTLARLDRWSDDPRVTVIPLSENTGAAQGNNVGLERALAADVPLILFTNNDVAFGPSTLVRLIAEKRRLPAGLLSATLLFDEPVPRVWYNDGRIERWTGVRCVHRDRPLADVPGGEPYAVDYAPTTFLLADRTVIDDVGLLDPAYFAYWEDADYLFRARRAEYGIWVSPDVHVVHKVSASSGGGGSPYSHQQYYRNQLLFARKHFGAVVAGYTAAISSLRIVVQFLLRRDRPVMTRAKLRGLRLGVAAACGQAGADTRPGHV